MRLTCHLRMLKYIFLPVVVLQNLQVILVRKGSCSQNYWFPGKFYIGGSV